MKSLQLFLLKGAFSVVQLDAHASIPTWALSGEFFALSRTSEELSLVCLSENIPVGLSCDSGWVCFKLHGPFEFSQTGILLSVLEPLAKATIGIFAVSTFNTDYVLVKAKLLVPAIAALQACGHHIQHS
jgi:uncharacterized protein